MDFDHVTKLVAAVNDEAERTNGDGPAYTEFLEYMASEMWTRPIQEALRKEAFVQGWIRSRANSMGQDLADFDDETILEWLPFADEAYRKYRKHRS